MQCWHIQISKFIPELRRPEGLPSGAKYTVKIVKMVKMAVVLLVGAYARRRRFIVVVFVALRKAFFDEA